MTDRNWLIHCLLMLARSDDPRNATAVVEALDAYLNTLGQKPVALTAEGAYTKAQNFCLRCGKRNRGAFGQLQIHTCTPPRGLEMT